MRTKTERINIRTSPATKGVWLDTCRILDGESQTEIFEMVIMSIAKMIIDNRSTVETLKQIAKR